MLKKIGNIDAGEAFNQKVLPLYHIDTILSQLLVGQGANDSRMKQAEADQITFTMQKKNIPVEYVLYPNEAYGFARPDNRIEFNGRTELFLAKYLGSHTEAFETPSGSTA